MEYLILNNTRPNAAYKEYYTKTFNKMLKNEDRIFIAYRKNIQNRKRKDEEMIRKLQRNGVVIFQYKTYQNLLKKISYNKTIRILNFAEALVEEVNIIKRYFGQDTTENIKLFTNKNIQRQYLKKNYKESTIQYYHCRNMKNMEFKKIKELGYPIIVKPSQGKNSSATFKVNNKCELNIAIKEVLRGIEVLKTSGLKNKGIIFEEFIDGQFYTIDYFVNENQKIYISSGLVESQIAFELGLDDVCVMNEKIHKNLNKYSFKEELIGFIKKTVIACKIKNTYIHHEFKYTRKKEFKTIEINGRIGGHRLEMYQKAFSENLITLDQRGEIETKELKYFIGYTGIRSNIEGKIISINNNYSKEIKQLESFKRLRLVKKRIGERVGFAKNGFDNLGIILIQNKSQKIFKKDFDYITENCLNYVKV